MYRGVALALGLLVTPAAAETYTQDDCDFIEVRLNHCAEGPEPRQFDWEVGSLCNDIKSGSEARRLRYFWDMHPALVRHCPKLGRAELDCKSEQAFRDLCDKVCHHEMTTMDALSKYCPKRPKL